MVATLLLAAAAAPLCLALHTPLRNLGQWVIGSALGLYFTPQAMALVGGIWWAIALAIVYALAMGWLFGLWLQKQYAGRMSSMSPSAMRATAYFSGAIGGASEMTLMAERVGARTGLVATAHSLRLMVVTIAIPFAMQWSGLHGLEINPPSVREVHWSGLALLAVATGAGGLLIRAAGRTNPWFIDPLVVAMGFTVSGVQLSAVPTSFSNMAQLVIAVSLGVRFSREFLHTAPRWIATRRFAAGRPVVRLALRAAGRHALSRQSPDLQCTSTGFCASSA